MDIKLEKISTADEYTHFVREFVTLLDEQFRTWEEWAQDKQKLGDLAHQMPSIISLVNTVGYLRGQDGIFLGIRPETENQKEFYNYEGYFEKRLEKLIDALMASEKKELYQQRLESYLIKARTKQTPTIW